ncbi:MAG: CIA30 family protein [Xanthomonadaceae bacterium]|jgi:hypothetical protein|nr:CIA30 family protein [Xanthomonadaceae bacterium]
MPSVDLMRFDDARVAAAWEPVDDRVMGGVSRSRVRHDPAGHAVFEGLLSLDRGGGFASVRAPVAMPTAIGAIHAFALVVRGDGRRYKLNLRTGGRFDDVNYQAAFTPATDQWSEVRLPTAAFAPTFRGRTVAAPPLDPAAVSTLGLMVADRQQGAFALALRRIACEVG